MGNKSVDLPQSIKSESMEEILSSIRKIMDSDLSDLPSPPKTRKIEADQDILELTKRASFRTDTPSITPPTIERKQDNLLSPEALSASVRALSQLNQPTESSSYPHAKSERSISKEGIEEFVGFLLRPMLQEWLNKNLPHIVESIVHKEVQDLKKNLSL